MTEPSYGSEAGAVDGQEEEAGWKWMSSLVWIVGLISTIFIVGWALLLSFLSIAFIKYSTMDFEWLKVASVAIDTIPLCCFAAIGFVGLRFWPHGQFRLWGLSAIILQTAMAVWFFASPEGLLVFTRWPF